MRQQILISLIGLRNRPYLRELAYVLAGLAVLFNLVPATRPPQPTTYGHLVAAFGAICVGLFGLAQLLTYGYPLLALAGRLPGELLGLSLGLCIWGYLRRTGRVYLAAV